MTNDTTPATIGADAALAQLRHLYDNLANGGVRDTAQAKRIAEGLLAPAIAALERATLASAAQPADFDADRAMRAQAAPAAQGDAEDAARYRWLREHKALNNTHCWHFQGGPIIPGLLTLDAAIDAARSQAKEGQSHD